MQNLHGEGGYADQAVQMPMFQVKTQRVGLREMDQQPSLSLYLAHSSV